MIVLSHLVRMLAPSRLVEAEEDDRGQASEDPLNEQTKRTISQNFFYTPNDQ